MRLGLVTRTGLIVVASLTVALIGQVVLFQLALNRDGPRTQPLPGQIAALVELAERAPPDERALLLRAVTSEVLEARVEAGLEIRGTSPRRVPRVTARLLRSYLDALGGRPVGVTLAPPPDRRWRSAGRWFVTPVDLEVRVGLQTGETLVVDVRTTPVASLWGLPVGFALGLFGAFVGLAALLVVHREMRPLARLVSAVERIDPSGDQPLLPVPRQSAPEVRALVAAFNGLLERLAQLLRARLALLGGISHDVRTFATRLRLRLEQIPVEAERERAASDIDDMIRLLDDALLASRAGGHELAEELVELAALVRAEVEDRQARGAELELDESGAVSEPIVLGDRLALRRVVANLLENALAYGRRARVTLRSDEAAVALIVDDEGPGIPPDQRRAVLEPFVRLEASRSRRTGGAGLGLAVVRAVVETHGGQVAISDAATGGARLLVRLPLFRAKAGS